jgi:hypothetical protein
MWSKTKSLLIKLLNVMSNINMEKLRKIHIEIGKDSSKKKRQDVNNFRRKCRKRSFMSLEYRSFS